MSLASRGSTYSRVHPDQRFETLCRGIQQVLIRNDRGAAKSKLPLGRCHEVQRVTVDRPRFRFESS